MTESTSRSIPLQILQADTPSAPLQAGVKQIGGDKNNPVGINLSVSFE